MARTIRAGGRDSTTKEKHEKKSKAEIKSKGSPYKDGETVRKGVIYNSRIKCGTTFFQKAKKFVYVDHEYKMLNINSKHLDHSLCDFDQVNRVATSITKLLKRNMWEIRKFKIKAILS